MRLLVAATAILTFFLNPQPVAARPSSGSSSVRPGASSPTAPVESVSASVDDGSSTRLVNRIIGALSALGIVMLATTVWLWRSSRPVAPHLEGLDLITKRRWLRAHDGRRDDLLASIRDGRGAAPPPNIVLDGHAISTGPAMPVSPTASDTSLGVAGGGPDAVVPVVGVEEISPLADPAVPDDLAVLKPTLPPPAVPPLPSGLPAVEASYGDTHG